MFTPKSIDQLKQNKPSLIVEDLCDTSEGLTRDSIYEVLLSRGVFKWFSVRRKLIKTKNHWKNRLKTAFDYQILARSSGRWNRVWYWKGYRKALEECRADIRRLCHEPRWQVQDNDQRAQQWLWALESQTKKKLIEEEKSLLFPSCECGPSEIPKDASGNL